MAGESMTAREARAAQRRRRAAVGEPRTSDFRVKVTAAERADLERVAAARRVTVARLLIDSTLTPERLGLDAASFEATVELRGARRDLGRVGENINQLTKIAHVTGRVPELAPALAQLRELRERIS